MSVYKGRCVVILHYIAAIKTLKFLVGYDAKKLHGPLPRHVDHLRGMVSSMNARAALANWLCYR